MSYFRSSLCNLFVVVLVLAACVEFSYGDYVEEPPMNFAHHGGALLTGTITVNFIWYGNFTASQKNILIDFVESLSATATATTTEPSVSTWWSSLKHYYDGTGIAFPILTLGKQITDSAYSQGVSLNVSDITSIAAWIPDDDAINVIATSAEVAMEGFCISRCGLHGAGPGSKAHRFTYIWLGNSSTQCAGQCAWPFSQIEDGPSVPALTPPNGEPGTDGMVVNLASLLAGTCTNPYGDGYFQGEPETPLEAATACPGIYGKRAFPGYAGDLLTDPVTNASYNAYGVNGRRFLVPALLDLNKFGCATTV